MIKSNQINKFYCVHFVVTYIKIYVSKKSNKISFELGFLFITHCNKPMTLSHTVFLNHDKFIYLYQISILLKHDVSVSNVF